MKTLKIFGLIFLIFSLFPSCKKEGPAGPQGLQGEKGASSSANIQYYGTTGSGQADITTNTYTQIPGLNLTILLTAPAILHVFTNGGISPSVNYGAIVSGTVGLFVNDALVPTCFQTIDIWTAGLSFKIKSNWSMATVLTLQAGTYNFDIRVKKNGNDNFYAGTTNYSQSSMLIQVFY